MGFYIQNIMSRLLRIQILNLFFFVALGSNTIAQTPYQRVVRIIDTNELGISSISGLAYSHNIHAFLSIINSGPSRSSLSQINKFGNPDGTIEIGLSIVNPINMSFNSRENILLYYDNRQDELIEIKSGSDEYPDFSDEKIARHQLHALGLVDVQGLALDPENGDMYILDTYMPRIVHIIPDYRNRNNGVAISKDGSVSTIELSSLQGTELRGIAYNDLDGHFFVTSPSEKRLYELNHEGQIISWRDLKLWNYTNTDGLLFAPSGDQTDDPSINSLYIVDSGINSGRGGIIELELLHKERLTRPESTVRVNSFRVSSWNSHRFAEESASNEPSDPSIDAISVNTTLTSLWSPPSPDPTGVAFFIPSNHLLVSDSEVNEVTIYEEANVFESTFAGSLVDTFTTLSFSNEPTGIAYNPDNGHIFISDDNADDIYEIDAGDDGEFGNADDIVTFFDTNIYGSGDPEGIAFDAGQGHLFIVDGVNTQVYEIDPGDNGIFDGIPAWGGDDVLSDFDVGGFGLDDPEGVEFNSLTGNLYVVSVSNDIVVEMTRSGSFVREIDIAFLNAWSPSGIGYAPSSVNPGEWSLYISDRAQDNSQNENENDGKIYEITDEDISLPVELASFTADIVKNTIQLEWITESEIDNIGFEVMRSEEEKGNYAVITSYTDNSELVGQGNSSTRHIYSYEDELVEAGRTYWYRLVDLDITGKRSVHGPVSVTMTQPAILPVAFKIHPNYPNPFNPTTNIKIEIPISNSGLIDIRIEIYNNLGQLVKTLSQEKLSAGIYNIPWDSTTDNNYQAPAGIYYARLSVGTYSQSIKMILLK